MDYKFQEIEKKWQKQWVDDQTYKVTEDKSRPKYYVLNMFPYPSGAGLHVGHPLGYIASDIYARYKRQCGFNVLNPMGYDAYGLPAEQYAIKTGQHPAITTEANINHYREQLDKIGFCFDWDREVRTCDPGYYHWTQWAFQKMFMSFYDNAQQKALPISQLVEHFEKQGTEGLNVAQSEELSFTADEWKAMGEKQKEETLMNYRIAYKGETMVNWCAGLGTVLANDEVVEGVSVRGGFPVVQKKMSQFGPEDETSTIAEGFVTASLLYCVGAMSIVGALNSGLMGDHDMLFAKSLLDGTASIIFTVSLGVGVPLSAIAVFCYQVPITLAASVLSPFLGESVIAEMTCVGSLLILAISLNMLGITKIKVMNLIPAIFLPIFLCRFF